MQPFEEKVKEDLYKFLLSEGEVDKLLPKADDIEATWASVGEAYLADGVREFAHYPIASLGWAMYLGMAIAKYWDDDWEVYSHLDNLYQHIVDKSGFDLMDEYIRGSLLGLRQPQYDATEQLVQQCAQRTHAMLMRANFEPATEAAFRGYVASIHQLYLMGAAVQLKRMGYHMTKVN